MQSRESDLATITTMFERARLLSLRGRGDEARQAYLDLLALQPTHFAGLSNLGTLLAAGGWRAAAKTAYGEALRHHPAEADGHVNLANLLLQERDLTAARRHYRTALVYHPFHQAAHQGLAHLSTALGEEAAAARHRRAGFLGNAVTELPYEGEGEAVPVLLLVSSTGGDIPIRRFLDPRRYRTTVVVADYLDPTQPRPPHRLVVNAVGDADLCRPALDMARTIVAASPAPVINHPEAVLATGRIANAARFKGVPGVVTPAMASLPRHLLAGDGAAAALAQQGLGFPLLLRTPGFHAGQYFRKVDGPGDLPAVLAALPGDELTAIEFLDAKGTDGKIRKYRVMFIDGRLYPLHAAVSTDWMVHYFSAEMAENPENRAIDGAFLADMEGVLGAAAMAALGRVADILGLDYAGADFSLGRGGEVLLFEANATMVVNPPDPDPRWAYRRAPVERILAAIAELLLSRT
ncbi:MAG TPA: hypothetical protein HPQ04_14355 [Rhodospirillaceae bacterium]|nr:hypothetical protein [Rhodospirillaceae bacterium]